MLGSSRRIGRMGARVVGFLEAHPLTQAPAMEIVRRFGEVYQQIVQRSAEQESGLSGALATTTQRSELRSQMQKGALRHIRRIVKAMAEQVPSVALATSRQALGRSHEAFLASVQSIRGEVEQHQDLLIANGMTPASLAELVSQEQEFLRLEAAGNAARRLHTGATADLKGLTRRLMLLVGQLDGIVKYEFRGNLQVLGEWESARNVAWPASTTQAPAEQPKQLPPGAQGQPGA